MKIANFSVRFAGTRSPVTIRHIPGASPFEGADLKDPELFQDFHYVKPTVIRPQDELAMRLIETLSFFAQRQDIERFFQVLDNWEIKDRQTFRRAEILAGRPMEALSLLGLAHQYRKVMERSLRLQQKTIDNLPDGVHLDFEVDARRVAFNPKAFVGNHRDISYNGPDYDIPFQAFLSIRDKTDNMHYYPVLEQNFRRTPDHSLDVNKKEPHWKFMFRTLNDAREAARKLGLRRNWFQKKEDGQERLSLPSPHPALNLSHQESRS